ncbi:MAG: GTP-binding protein [Eubacteriales bacterium]|nr:GTP-binding protein [Eubacteriales bacterium]
MKLYLITGFLGAGKTTLMKNLIDLFSAHKLCVIVNEFGREGIDGDRLARLGVAVSEIDNGSIFCSCRIDQFEEALTQAIAAQPEVILVEASGLSDPGNMETVLAQSAFAAIEYQGSICVADALRFPKALSGVRACRKQVRVSRLVLLNKADEASPEQLEQTQTMIRQVAPGVQVRITSFGKVEPQWLELTPTGEAMPRFQSKDLGLVRRLIRLRPIATPEELRRFIAMFAADTYRVKGYAVCGGQDYLADCVGDSIVLTPEAAPRGHALRLNVLSGPGLALEASLAEAIKWYPQLIEAIEK